MATNKKVYVTLCTVGRIVNSKRVQVAPKTLVDNFSPEELDRLLKLKAVRLATKVDLAEAEDSENSEDNSNFDRDAAMEEAKELGLNPTKKWSDETLIDRIAEARAKASKDDGLDD